MDEVKVILDKSLKHYDSGGGCRQVRAEISIDESLSPRMKRQVLLYEILGACLGCVIAHDELEKLADIITDALDQLDSIGEAE